MGLTERVTSPCIYLYLTKVTINIPLPKHNHRQECGCKLWSSIFSAANIHPNHKATQLLLINVVLPLNSFTDLKKVASEHLRKNIIKKNLGDLVGRSELGAMGAGEVFKSYSKHTNFHMFISKTRTKCFKNLCIWLSITTQTYSNMETYK